MDRKHSYSIGIFARFQIELYGKWGKTNRSPWNRLGMHPLPPPLGIARRLISSSQSKHQVQRRLLLDVVIRQSPSILQLLSSEDQSLLLRWDSLFILNLGLHVLDGIIWFHIQRNSLSRQRLDKDLHRTTSQSQHQVQGRFFLDIVIRQRAAILQLLTGENQPLLLRW